MSRITARRFAALPRVITRGHEFNAQRFNALRASASAGKPRFSHYELLLRQPLFRELVHLVAKQLVMLAYLRKLFIGACEGKVARIHEQLLSISDISEPEGENLVAAFISYNWNYRAMALDYILNTMRRRISTDCMQVRSKFLVDFCQHGLRVISHEVFWSRPFEVGEFARLVEQLPPLYLIMERLQGLQAIQNQKKDDLPPSSVEESLAEIQKFLHPENVDWQGQSKPEDTPENRRMHLNIAYLDYLEELRNRIESFVVEAFLEVMPFSEIRERSRKFSGEIRKHLAVWQHD